MQISKRLKTVASFVSDGRYVADIGTDHAYVPIYLTGEGKCSRALAMDIREGPLAHAREHIRERGLESKIEVRLSDGLAAFRQGEADSIVIAGMGGALITRILSEGAQKLIGVKELILSPQSELFLVRGWLRKNGWRTEKEAMLKEEGKYYTVIKAVLGLGEEAQTDPVKDRYGGYLLENRNPVLKEYLIQETETLHRILASLSKGQEKQTKELREKLSMAEEALTYYEM